MGSGCGVTETGANDVVFGRGGDFAPCECGSLLCVGHGNRHWKRHRRDKTLEEEKGLVCSLLLQKDNYIL